MSVWKIDAGGKGNHFDHTHFDGNWGGDPNLLSPSKLSPFLSRIEIWQYTNPNGTYFGAIRLTWDDGKDSGFLGADLSSAEKHTFDLQRGEHLTDIWLGSSIAFVDYIGYIHLKTNKGRAFELGSADKTWTSGIASGMIFGVHGYSDEHGLTGLGFYFLQDVASVGLDIKFDALPDPSSIAPQSFATLDGDNTGGGVPLKVQISKSKNVTNTTATTEGWSETAGFSVKTSLDVLGISESEVGISFSATHQKSKTNSYANSETITWTGAVDVPPYEHYGIDLLYYTADVEVQYNAEVTFYCNNGTQRTHIWPGKAQSMVAQIAKIRSRKL